ncbi:MAG: PilZ domain-containing protein [Candidatus Gastranaerophilales bacterium]|nr:PilZ domain-containing protein [Candidatus Gastranaerophilales bacterium]
MDEIRRNHKVLIELKGGSNIEGVVLDYTSDRVMVSVDEKSYDLAKKLQELEDVVAVVNTHLGIKKMNSSIISSLNKENCIIIENTQTIPVVQKREFVRVTSNLSFVVFSPKTNKELECKAVNISAGGVAFSVKNEKFDLEDDVIIKFSSDDFEKDIKCNAKIIKTHENYYVAKYVNLNPHDEDKIVKYVFKMIAKK